MSDLEARAMVAYREKAEREAAEADRKETELVWAMKEGAAKQWRRITGETATRGCEASDWDGNSKGVYAGFVLTSPARQEIGYNVAEEKMWLGWTVERGLYLSGRNGGWWMVNSLEDVGRALAGKRPDGRDDE